MSRPTATLLVVFVAVLLGTGFLVYLVLERTSPRSVPAATSTSVGSAQPGPTAPAAPPSSDSILSELFGADVTTTATPEPEASWQVIAMRIVVRFMVAALLAAALAFRPRKNVAAIRRNPYVAQTQILLAVVAAAMMMIVGDSAARAFGIFAAASLVRFRTNIRDPKETTVLLICLGVGLAAGVGRLDMAMIFTIFVLLALWILERFESGQVFRAMEIKVQTKNLDKTHEVLRDLFSRHKCSPELRELERENEDGIAKIVYLLNLGTETSTDHLSEEILSRDMENVKGLEWDQKRSTTYIYR